MLDLRFLTRLELGECEYGAASCPIHPFICELKSKGRPLTGEAVLAALQPQNFQSSYIQNLDVTYIPYPGYHPGHGRGIQNDEIHNDFAGQYIFQNKDEDTDEEVDELSDTHGVLKQNVIDGKLWYVLLHTTPIKMDEYQTSRYVVLFAVGQSPNGERLLGVVSHQVCHNLCD